MVWGFESPPAHQPFNQKARNIMSVQVETLDKLERRITLTLAADTITSEVQSRLKRLARTVKADGFRQHSAGEFRQLNTGGDWVMSGSTVGTVRLSLADNPEAENPGALTRTEYDINPDSAAPNNIIRGADKDVQQQQLALDICAAATPAHFSEHEVRP